MDPIITAGIIAALATLLVALIEGIFSYYNSLA